MSRVLALDPGNVQSGWCIMDRETLRPLQFDKTENRELARMIMDGELEFDEFVAERVRSYGMAVGREVFMTCEWTGRFVQIALEKGVLVSYIHRKDEKLHICGDSRAKDVNLRRALIERFATKDLKNGKGRKGDPDWFYGFHGNDIWAAYCVGLTFIEAGPSEVEV